MRKLMRGIESGAAIAVYRLMELIDGEKGLHLVAYRRAQAVKVVCLAHI